MVKIIIRKAKMNCLADCTAALLNSRLGQEYFSVKEKAHHVLREGIKKGEIYVAVDSEGKCLGFIWFISEGVFHSFPYIHIIAVQETSRGNGIGKKLLSFVEDIVFPAYSKVFLLVAAFNPEAKRLYEKLGYKQVGAIPGLYKDGVLEYLMMKKQTA